MGNNSIQIDFGGPLVFRIPLLGQLKFNIRVHRPIYGGRSVEVAPSSDMRKARCYLYLFDPEITRSGSVLLIQPSVQ